MRHFNNDGERDFIPVEEYRFSKKTQYVWTHGLESRVVNKIISHIRIEPERWFWNLNEPIISAQTKFYQIYSTSPRGFELKTFFLKKHRLPLYLSVPVLSPFFCLVSESNSMQMFTDILYDDTIRYLMSKRVKLSPALDLNRQITVPYVYREYTSLKHATYQNIEELNRIYITHFKELET